MPPPRAIFRPFRRSPAERSDRSAGDRLRHREKVREAIRDNIADIVAEESIIGKHRDKVIKVPIRGVKEYRFVYGDNAPGVGQGDGETQPGQVVGKNGKPGAGQGDGRAGDAPGQDVYETDVSLEELVEIMFEDLELPDLERKALRQLPAERTVKRKGYRSVGIRVRLDKRRTAKERIRRLLAASRHQAAAGPGTTGDTAARPNPEETFGALGDAGPAELDELDQLETDEEADGAADAETSPPAGATPAASPGSGAPGAPPRRKPFFTEDLTYRHMVSDLREESNAVVLCIMDTSGSMDTMKKYLARSFFFLFFQFISTKYRAVELVFIAHHTEAREVTEEEFFHKVESGGTMISSGYQKALDIIEERYHPSLWNVYAFHCSDGDNFDSDNPAAMRTAKLLTETCNLFGYGEIKPLGSRYYESSMLNLFRRLDADNFQTLVIERKEDIWPSFRAFLAKDRRRTAAEAAAGA